MINDLDEIAKVDPRVEILWEDCGEFPYGYEAFVVDEKRFENTLSFTKKLLELRGGAGVGLVFKGVMMLDWTKFFSQHGHYVMGENHREIAAHDRHIRAKGWRMFSAQWMQSGQRVAQILQYIQDHKLSQVDMCLAGTFDGGIYLPMALCAQLYWDCREDYPELLKRVTNRPCITVD